MSNARTRRRGDDDRSEAVRAQRGNASRPARLLVRVVSGGSMPSTVPGRYLGQILELDGDGSAAPATYRDIAGRVVFTCLGSAPAVGDRLVIHQVSGYWVAQRRGAAGSTDQVTVPGCPCTLTPRVLYMTSSLPLSNNRIFQNATFTYRDTPSALLPAGLGTQAYFSVDHYVDHETGDLFLYYLFCYQFSYLLTRVYETSIYGSPYRDLVRYSWMIGQPGNTCSPFLLAGGTIFPGGDPACVVTITP